MQRTDFERDFFTAFKDSTIGNYVVPGLESVLLGKSNDFTVRMFHMTEHQVMHITPHSHRFNLLSYVLKGEVEHHVYYTAVSDATTKLKDFRFAVMEQKGQLGNYDTELYTNGLFRRYESKYEAGSSYFLKAEEYHSVIFSKGAKVLIIEGPEVATSKVLVPLVKNTVCSTLFTADWMFKK